jgi:hypothetical protein
MSRDVWIGGWGVVQIAVQCIPIGDRRQRGEGKIVIHDRCSFYNPRRHPCFDLQGSRVVCFEGPCTAAFSGNTDLTPRYDYNQMVYKLDLSKILPIEEASPKKGE